MRVAIYFAPPVDHPLSVAAAAWLGRDAWTGARLERGRVEGFDPATLGTLTAEPRRYGFHATMKPPFRLADNQRLSSLRAGLYGCCRYSPPVTIAALRLDRIGPFFALLPEGDADRLNGLSEMVVSVLDSFRAPPTPEEIARRRPERLTARQREYLTRRGYPYVFDEFRFHMTLTGPVPEEHAELMEAALRDRFGSFVGQPLAVDRLCLFIELDPPGDFVVDTAMRLTGAVVAQS